MGASISGKPWWNDRMSMHSSRAMGIWPKRSMLMGAIRFPGNPFVWRSAFGSGCLHHGKTPSGKFRAAAQSWAYRISLALRGLTLRQAISLGLDPGLYQKTELYVVPPRQILLGLPVGAHPCQSIFWCAVVGLYVVR